QVIAGYQVREATHPGRNRRHARAHRFGGTAKVLAQRGMHRNVDHPIPRQRVGDSIEPQVCIAEAPAGFIPKLPDVLLGTGPWATDQESKDGYALLQQDLESADEVFVTLETAPCEATARRVGVGNH